ncbi:MAG: rhodanese-like domain-containing protein [Leptolyngbya sp. IPPAS B-1204]|nr:MAG: rhodanese-like domain-containing protein [Leptolyngbya sp. IPPAS B-1204]
MGLLQTISWRAVKALISAQFPQVQQISIAELANWLQQSPQLLLLDTRTPEEYGISHLPNAILAPENLEELPSRGWLQDTPIVTYCSVGYRSAKVADQLQQMGYRPVWNLDGSIFAWANAGYPVYRDGEVVQQVHPYNARWGMLLKPELHCMSCSS